MRLRTRSWTGLEVGQICPDIDGLVRGLDGLCSFIFDQPRHQDTLVGPLGALMVSRLWLVMMGECETIFDVCS